MNKSEMRQLSKLSGEIRNFKACYELCDKLRVNEDGSIGHEDLLIWLMNNPHMAEIANDIKKIRQEMTA